MRKILVPLLGAAFAVLFCVVLVDAQPAPGFSKTYPLTGTGSSGSPLRMSLCSASQILKMNAGGTAYECAADSSGGVTDGDKGDITVSSSGTVWNIDANAVGLTEMADMSAGFVFIGRDDGTTGDPEHLSSGQATALLTQFSTSSTSQGVVPGSNGGGATVFLNGNGGWTVPAGAGDITSVTATAPLSGGSCTSGACTIGMSNGDRGDITQSTTTNAGDTWTIDNSAVTFAKIANIATARILGRVTASSGVVEELTGTQATTLLDVFTSGLKGLAPASGGGTTNFLRADGTWAAPPGGLTCSGCSTNAVLKYNGTNAVNSTITDNGTTVATTVAFSVDGAFTAGNANTDTQTFNGNSTWNAPSSGNSILTNGPVQVNSNFTASSYVYSGGGGVYSAAGIVLRTSGDIVALTSTNAEANLVLNAVGYNEGTTQPRGVEFQNGQGVTNWIFDGSDKHIYSHGSAPSLSGCAVCTIASYSTDARGKITCTDGPAACTVTFAVGYTTNAPSCVFQGTTTTRPYQTSAPTTSAFTVTMCPAGGCSIDYHCDGML